jgi:hypothetical protein
MESTRVQYGATERIMVTVLKTDGTPYTGLTDVLLEIRQRSTGKYYDFTAGSFKSSGWTVRQKQMTELSSTYSPGVYYYDFNTTGFSAAYTEEDYFIRATSSTAGGVPSEGELQVGGYVNQIGVFEGGIRGTEGLDKKQMIELAKMVWDVILQGKQTAKDVLLSRSEFDAAVDKVLLKEKIDLKPVIIQQKANTQAQKDYTRELKQLLIAVKRIKMEKPTDYMSEFKKLEKMCMAMPEQLAPVLENIRTGVRDIQGARDDAQRQSEIAKATVRNVTELMDKMNKVQEEMTKIPEEIVTEVKKELPKLDSKRFKEIPAEIL